MDFLYLQGGRCLGEGTLEDSCREGGRIIGVINPVDRGKVYTLLENKYWECSKLI